MRTQQTTDTSTATEQLTDAQREEAEAQAQADFAAGFNKVAKKDEAITDAADKGEATADKAPEKSDAELKAEERARVEAEANATEEKRWEGVPQVVRERLQSLDALTGRMSNIEGHIGGLKNATGRIETALKAAKTAAESAGGAAAAPSETQVKAALSDPKAWDRLKEDYPDWAKPVEAELAAMRSEIAKKGGSVDVDGVTRQVAETLTPTMQAMERRARSLAVLDVKHEDWEDTVNTPEFIAWSLAGGPSKDAYMAMKTLEETDQRKAAQVRHGFAQQYPQWWAEKGAQIFDDSPKAAIKLLDEFKTHTAQATKAAQDRQRNQRRIEAAVTPKGTTVQQQSGSLSDEDAFRRGFKRARGAR